MGKLTSSNYQTLKCKGALRRTKNTWGSMKDRCRDEWRKEYKYYGGRGISYDPRWEQFENFLEDMGLRPENTTLDRIDTNGNYERENCRWADKITQSYNKSDTLFCTNHETGVRYNSLEMAQITGLQHSTVQTRMIKGMSYDQIVNSTWGELYKITSNVALMSPVTLYYKGESLEVNFKDLTVINRTCGSVVCAIDKNEKGYFCRYKPGTRKSVYLIRLAAIAAGVNQQKLDRLFLTTYNNDKFDLGPNNILIMSPREFTLFNCRKNRGELIEICNIKSLEEDGDGLLLI